MRVLKDLGARRFNPDGVCDWQLVEYCADRLQEGGGEGVFVLGREGRNETDVHEYVQRSKSDGARRGDTRRVPNTIGRRRHGRCP